jgi:hypothetical protein
MTPIEYNILNNHIGYGSYDCEIAFMGIEEGANAATLHGNYGYRFGAFGVPLGPGLRSLRTFHEHAPLADMNMWFLGGGVLQPTWRNYCKFMIAYGGLAISELDYQLNHLGVPDGNNALLEYYPLPRPNNKYWDAGLMSVPHLRVIDDVSYKATLPDNDRLNSLLDITLRNKKLKAIIIHGSIRLIHGAYVPKPEYLPLLGALGIPAGVVPSVVHALDPAAPSNYPALEYVVNGKRIFLTKFFGMGAMTNTAIIDLAHIIK